MKIKVRCVSANLQPAPKEGPEVTMFRFVAVDPLQAVDQGAWYEGGLVVFSKDHGAYKVGSQYTITLKLGVG